MIKLRGTLNLSLIKQAAKRRITPTLMRNVGNGVVPPLIRETASNKKNGRGEEVFPPAALFFPMSKVIKDYTSLRTLTSELLSLMLHSSKSASLSTFPIAAEVKLF